MEITVSYGYRIYEIVDQIQEKIAKDIVHLTGINVLQVNVIIKNIVVEKT